MEKKKRNTYQIWPMIKRMLRVMKEEVPIQYVRMVIYAVAAGAYPFMGILLPKLAIGMIENQGEAKPQRLIMAMVVYFAVAGVLAFVSGYLSQVMSATSIRLRLRYISRMTGLMQNMDYKYVEDSKFQEENAKAFQACSNNVTGVEGVYNHILKLPAKTITVLGMMIFVCTLSPVLLIALILHVAVNLWASNKSHDYQYAHKEALGKATRKMKYFRDTTNDFTFGKDIRIFNFRERIIDNYKTEIKSYTNLRKKLVTREWLYGLAGLVTMLITNVIMYGILIYKTYCGMPISSFTMYVFLVGVLMNRMVEYSNDVSFIRNEGQYVHDFFELLDRELISEGQLETVPSDIEIVFDHVTFRYPGSDKDIFKDFCFTVHKGERLAIVGVNGAGKTTLVKLMCGLYTPIEGRILINGIDLREYKKDTLYRIYGTVFQDFQIFGFPLKENVACASKEIDEKRVMTALESVGLGKKVSELEHGLDQMMLKIVDENGTDFSGGERQKLAIARALYKDAPMVIMDEPTAALDALAEAEIYESFSDLVKGKTAIYISHRLASTKFCDKIALFDKTGVKEYGTHEELMERKGMYYDMFVIQGKYYQEDAQTGMGSDVISGKEREGEIA